jgi:hypothetical protein
MSSPPTPKPKNIVYRNLKSENSQDYAQQPQRNCMFMKTASYEHSQNESEDEYFAGIASGKSVFDIHNGWFVKKYNFFSVPPSKPKLLAPDGVLFQERKYFEGSHLLVNCSVKGGTSLLVYTRMQQF